MCTELGKRHRSNSILRVNDKKIEMCFSYYQNTLQNQKCYLKAKKTTTMTLNMNSNKKRNGLYV